MVKRHNYTPSIQYPLRNIIIKNTLKTGINEIKTTYLNEITSFIFLQCKYVLYVHGYNYKTKVFHSVHVRDVSTPKLHGEEWTSTVKASSKGVCDSGNQHVELSILFLSLSVLGHKDTGEILFSWYPKKLSCEMISRKETSLTEELKCGEMLCSP